MDNRREFIASWFALALLGAVEVPVNQHSIGDRLVHVLSHSRSTTVVIQADYVGQLDAVAHRLPELRRLLVVGSGAEASRFEIVPWDLLDDGSEASGGQVKFSDPVALMYTSGSTGPAKGAVLSHGHHYMNGYQAATSAGIEADDVIYVSTPLHHNMAQGYGVWPAIVAGASVRLAPRFDRRTFWTDVRASAATVFPFVGAMLVLLSKNPRQPDDCANPLRVGYGVPIPANLHRDLEHRFGIRLIHCYGSTEATIVAWGADGDAVPGAAGHTFPGYTVEIRDEEDRELPPTAVGEICVRSDEPCGMFSGYYADPKRTATALRDGWFHTGDRGWKDEQGRLWFAGRIGDSIRCKGENISSYEIEEVFVAHPAVALVAAYGVPSDLGDEDIVLTVVPQPGRQIDPQELLAWSETRLSRYARPRYVDVVDSLPMTPTGKIEKYKLRDRGPSAWAFDSIASPLTAASPVEPHGQRTT